MVAAKLDDGDNRGAVRLACSQMIPWLTDATYANRDIHHTTQTTPLLCNFFPHSFSPISVSEDEISHAIRYSPTGSAGGPDGLRMPL